MSGQTLDWGILEYELQRGADYEEELRNIIETLKRLADDTARLTSSPESQYLESKGKGAELVPRV